MNGWTDRHTEKGRNKEKRYRYDRISNINLSVSKRRHIKLKRNRIAQNKEYNNHKTAKVRNREN